MRASHIFSFNLNQTNERVWGFPAHICRAMSGFPLLTERNEYVQVVKIASLKSPAFSFGFLNCFLGFFLFFFFWRRSKIIFQTACKVYNDLFTSTQLGCCVLWPVFYVRQWQRFCASFVLNCHQYNGSSNEAIRCT